MSLEISTQDIVSSMEANAVDNDGVRLFPCETGANYLELQHTQVLDALVEITEKQQDVQGGLKKWSACELLVHQILCRHVRACRGER